MAGTLAAAIGGAAAWALSVFNTQQPLFSQNANITAILGPRLSPQAAIYSPGSEGYAEAANRWITWKNPQFGEFVQVATESDIEETIRFANEQNRPFLAVSGGHGGTAAMANVKNGIGIYMRGLKNVHLKEDGKTAIIGGGIKSGELVRTLWDLGKQSTTGACDCTGVVGPMLGGGHGWLQGRYGTLADNLVSARLTIANGTTITVSSTSHPDLFWGIRGAGHNFGIVSSFEYKVHDVTPENDKWAWQQFVFNGEKLEDVYEVAKTMVGTKENVVPVELMHFGFMQKIPDIDAEKPIIMLHLIYQGASIPEKYRQPLESLGPLSANSGVSSLPDFSTVMVMAEGQFPCQRGRVNLRHPTDVKQYNTTALRNAYNLLSNLPEPFASSVAITTQAYSLDGKRRVPADSTAVPGRETALLLSDFFWYETPEAHEAEAVHAQAEALSLQLRNALHGDEGPLHAYVNYALGDETLEEVYGHEKWRLEKLRRLKREYDPEGRFGYYVPITQ